MIAGLVALARVSRRSAQAKAFYDELAAERKLLTVLADAGATDKLAKRFVNDAVGGISVQQRGGRLYLPSTSSAARWRHASIRMERPRSSQSCRA